LGQPAMWILVLTTAIDGDPRYSYSSVVSFFDTKLLCERSIELGHIRQQWNVDSTFYPKVTARCEKGLVRG